MSHLARMAPCWQLSQPEAPPTETGAAATVPGAAAGAVTSAARADEPVHANAATAAAFQLSRTRNERILIPRLLSRLRTKRQSRLAAHLAGGRSRAGRGAQERPSGARTATGPAGHSRRSASGRTATAARAGHPATAGHPDPVRVPVEVVALARGRARGQIRVPVTVVAEGGDAGAARRRRVRIDPDRTGQRRLVGQRPDA